MLFEEIVDKKIKFKRDTSFRKQFFVFDSFAHPAKMDAQLLIWITEKFTKVGETILDPMFGSGTTMLACMLGRHVIGVELEQKFVDMAKANWEVVRMHPQLGYDMGKCEILQGDARNLEGLLADKVIISPPYSLDDRVRRSDDNPRTQDIKIKRRIATGKDFTYADKVIFSPPYADAIKRGDESPSASGKDRPSYEERLSESRVYSNDLNNIGNLPYGDIDAVITSPPYEGSIIDGNENLEGLRKIRGDKASQKERFRQVQFGKETTAYGKKQVDAAILSPPYAEQSDFRPQGGLKDLSIFQGGTNCLPKKYGGIDNIGNLKSDSYLSAMLQVYQSCYHVLRPQGLMILVTKNFIRGKKEVRLDEDTIKLCKQAGFTFQERWYRELPAQSFWRIIYKQKYPDAPEIKFEDVLVFNKKVLNVV